MFVKENQAKAAIWFFSFLAVIFLFWLIYFGKPESSRLDFGFLKYVNATLNFIAAVFLCCGFYCIKKGWPESHKRMMAAAFVASSLFLVSYIVYHYAHGDTPFLAQGRIRYFYFTILVSHVFLSVAVFPFIFITFYHALTGRFSKHRRLARFVFPVWLYVSLSGVAIVAMLEAFNPA